MGSADGSSGASCWGKGSRLRAEHYAGMRSGESMSCSLPQGCCLRWQWGVGVNGSTDSSSKPGRCGDGFGRLLGGEGGGVTFVSRRGGVGRGLLEMREIPALAASGQGLVLEACVQGLSV